MSDNIISGNYHHINIEDPNTKILFYEREIYFLKQQIELKDKEIEARDRDIEMLQKLHNKVEELAESNKNLYERKIEDLKRINEILQSSNYKN